MNQEVEVYFSIDQFLSIVICPMPLTRVPNTHCNACLTVSELLRNDRHHDHHPDHHDHRDHLSHMKTSNFWSGLVKRQKSYLVIRCCVTKKNYALFAWSVTLASGRRRYIQIAMIDIQIVSYQSRKKLFKIFYNILYWNQCCSPSLALTQFGPTIAKYRPLASK